MQPGSGWERPIEPTPLQPYGLAGSPARSLGRDWQIRFKGQYEVLGQSISYRVTEVSESTGTLTRPGRLLGVIGGDTVTIRTHTSETAVYVRQP